MRALEHVVVGGKHKPRLEHSFRLGLVLVEELEEHVGVGDLEVVGRMLDLALVVYVAVGDVVDPLEIVDVVDLLDEHRDSLKPVCKLSGHYVHIDGSHLLEVRKLSDLHAVEPDFPSKPPRSRSRVLPVVLDEADVVFRRVDAEILEALDVELLNVVGSRLDDDLILVIMLKAVRVLTIAPVGRPSRRFHVSDAPRFRAEDSQSRGRVHGTSAYLQIVRLLYYAALRSPKMFQAHN